MKLFELKYVCQKCYTIIVLLIFSSICLGQDFQAAIRNGIVEEWTKAGDVFLEYQSAAIGHKEQRGKYDLNLKSEAKMEVQNVCYEILQTKHLFVLVKAHMISIPEPAYILDGLTIFGICNKGALERKMVVVKSNKRDLEDKLTVEETYEIVFKIGEAGECYRRQYTVTQTNLDIVMKREDPIKLTSEECYDIIREPKAGKIVPYHTGWSPSGTFHQTSFDDSTQKEITIKFTHKGKGTETKIKCKKTLVARNRLIYVANLEHNGLIVDRFHVKACWRSLLETSFLAEHKNDPTVFFKKQGSCYERSYVIKEENHGDQPIKVYKVTKSSANPTKCPTMTSSGSENYNVAPADFVRYLEF